MKILLAQNIKDVFGTIKPPPGPGNLNAMPAAAGFGYLLAIMIRLILVLSGIVMLIYMLWGAFKWIASGGKADAVTQARSQIRDAAIGLIVMVIALGLFQVITVDILQIFQKGANGIEFLLPPF